MKSLFLALTFAFATSLVAAPGQTVSGHRTPQNQPGTPFTDTAIYFRDAYGRCLRLQLKPMDNGQLSVLVMSNDACVKRERTRTP